MSNIFPQYTKISFETDGEEKIFNLILSKLPSDWYIFYEPSINGRKPDFIILNRNFGIAILEVKDFTRKTIRKMDHFYWTIRVNNSFKEIKSPLKQCEEYRDKLINLLEMEEQLRSKSDIYKNRLKIPIISICVFPNLTKADVNKLSLYELINKNQLIHADDLKNVNMFFSKIESVRNKLFIPQELSIDDIKLISNRIYPIIQIRDLDRDKQSDNFTNYEIQTIQFHTFTDEISHVIDLISHTVNYKDANLSDICIIVSEQRASKHSFGKYLNTLQSTLKFKNYSYDELNYPKANSILITTYQSMGSQVNLSNYHYLYFVDFNNALTAELRPKIKKNIKQLSNTHSITITTNRPFEIKI